MSEKQEQYERIRKLAQYERIRKLATARGQIITHFNQLLGGTGSTVDRIRKLKVRNEELETAINEIGKHETYEEMDEQSRNNVDSMTGHDYFIGVARKVKK